MKREPKKTEFLEVRLPWATKLAFMTRCRERGVSASRLIRDWIDSYLLSPSRAPIEPTQESAMLPIRKRRYAAVGTALTALVGTGIIAALASAPASAASDPRLLAVFDWTDIDNDGRISKAEFFGDQRPVDPQPRSAEREALALTVDSKVPPRPGETREALFERLDSDGDGTLSSAEFVEGSVAHTNATRRIASADANGDGSLTEGELASFATADRTIAGDPKAIASGSMLARGVILEHDEDGDGKVPISDLLNR